MFPKSKKIAPSWFTCEKCHVNLVQRDIEIHETTNCPPSSADKFVHPYVLRGCLTGPLEIKTNEEIKGTNYHDKNNMVFLSQSAIQLCSLVIGDWAVIETLNSNIPACAKIVWPTTEKSLSSVLVTPSAYDLYWKNRTDCKVQVSKMSMQRVKEAKALVLIAVNAPKTLEFTQELSLRLRNLHRDRFIAKGNKLVVFFYGKFVQFLVKDIVPSDFEAAERTVACTPKNLETEFMELSVTDPVGTEFYQIVNTTVMKVFRSENECPKARQHKDLSSLLGGVDAELAEIQDLMDVALGQVPGVSGMKPTRGVLLYGTSGTGKTMIAKALAQKSTHYVVAINGPDLYSKYAGIETESTITGLFKEAIEHAPCLILLDEMDILCPVRSARIMDQEKRVVSTMLRQLDRLAALDDCRVFVLATSSRPDAIDPAFRRCGRIDRELEVSIPNPLGRYEILRKLLDPVAHELTEPELREIANCAHGFVGADVSALCSRAAMHAVKRAAAHCPVRITREDLKFALTRVRPSAMREVQIEVPDVRWKDIGGQRNLKLILRQAVEWPLKHSASFVRMGVTPPRGVLMYGPPGCSKTMIAKALATESGLNFLSIKGPELFSKWVGESERAVREVFRRARQVAPSVVFFDEIDALGGERSSGGGGGGGGSSSSGGSVQERVLAQLLTELDGVTPLGDVTVLAATNRPDRIDKALLRPGRLDRIVYVPLPDDETRREIFRLKLAKMPVEECVCVDRLVALSGGYSGAEVQAVCHEAAMKALEEDIEATSVTWLHFEQAFDIVTPRTPPSLIRVYEEYLKQ